MKTGMPRICIVFLLLLKSCGKNDQRKFGDTDFEIFEEHRQEIRLLFMKKC